MMNQKAEAFKKYLQEHQIEAFVIDEIKDDELNTVVFRSNVEIYEHKLPIIVILDSTIYGMIRLSIAPAAVTASNEEAVWKLVNQYNRTYKSFKYYLDEEGSLLLDACLVCRCDEVDGDMIYLLFEVIINHLQKAYPQIQEVLGGL